MGLVRDITAIVAGEKVNISTMNVANHDNHTTLISLTLETRSLTQLSRLLEKIEGLREVMGGTRMGAEATI